MFSYMVKNHIEKGGRALIFTHRKELLTQSGGAFERFNLNPEYIEAGKEPDLTKNLHVSMIETFHRRLDRYRLFLDTRTMIIVDECHINSFTKVLENINSKETYVIGVTATPYRKGKSIPELKEFYQDIGQKGGERTSQKYDQEFYEEIGQKGGNKRSRQRRKNNSNNS